MPWQHRGVRCGAAVWSLTRGRAGQLLEEEDSADEEFWKQDFFAEEEEARDVEYEEESEEEDVPDTDFSASVGPWHGGNGGLVALDNALYSLHSVTYPGIVHAQVLHW